MPKEAEPDGSVGDIGTVDSHFLPQSPTLMNPDKKSFLKDASGGFSSTRLIFVIGSIWNMALCTYLVFQEIEAGALVATFSALQGVFVGLKLGQKPMENKNESASAS